MQQISSFFDTYNSIAPYLVIGLFVLVIALVIWMIILSFRLRRTVNHYKTLLKDTNTKNLQQVLDDQLAVMQETSDQLADLNQKYDQLILAVLKCIQQVGVVRFNPFNDMGSDQSFAIALMDAQNNGIVVSSLHSREVTRIYAKPIVAGGSPNALSDEEQEAIKKAKNSRFATPNP